MSQLPLIQTRRPPRRLLFPQVEAIGYRIALEEELGSAEAEALSLPLRRRSHSGEWLAGGWITLRRIPACDTPESVAAAGSSLTTPLAGWVSVRLLSHAIDQPFAGAAPHPQWGALRTALRYGRWDWVEAGSLAVGAGHSEEIVAGLLAQGLQRLSERNGASALLGAQSWPLDGLAPTPVWKPFQSPPALDPADLGALQEAWPLAMRELLRQGAQPLALSPGKENPEILWSWFL